MFQEPLFAAMSRVRPGFPTEERGELSKQSDCMCVPYKITPNWWLCELKRSSSGSLWDGLGHSRRLWDTLRYCGTLRVREQDLWKKLLVLLNILRTLYLICVMARGTPLEVAYNIVSLTFIHFVERASLVTSTNKIFTLPNVLGDLLHNIMFHVLLEVLISSGHLTVCLSA